MKSNSMIVKRLQLALIHVAVAITLVPINSTLNRVMIKELAISATLVAILASLPYIFSPAQVLIGAYSDRHPLFGRHRTPYILTGLLLCVAGVVIAPQVVFLMPEQPMLGLPLSLLAFGAWGMGFNIASVSYISLASELSGEKGRSRTISIMWFLMILGIILTSITLSRLLQIYSPAALKTAFEWVGLVALALGLVGLVGLEPRSNDPLTQMSSAVRRASWRETAQTVLSNPQARRFFIYMIVLLAAILGQDVLLEPYAAEAFDLPVEATTRITSIWGGCVLVALLAAGVLEGRLGKRRVAQAGAWGAAAGFVIIALSGLVGMKTVFYGGVLVLGLATGLATVSNLSLMLDMTTTQVGLFIGAWGMADALARLLGTVLGGVVRDLVALGTGVSLLGYVSVFVIEAGLLLISLVLLNRIDVSRFRSSAERLSTGDRAALLNESSG